MEIKMSSESLKEVTLLDFRCFLRINGGGLVSANGVSKGD